MSANKKVGVIGCGFFAQFHLEAWQRLEGVEIAAICDQDEDKAQQAAQSYGDGCLVFTDVAKMLDSVRLDLVDIATPPKTHRGLVDLAAKRGVPILCQKPLADSLDEAEGIVHAAEIAGVPLLVHENFRFQPWYREIKRLLDAGMVGTVQHIAFRFRPGDGQGPNAYLERQPYFQTMERFLIHETAVHFLDVFRYLRGEVRSLSAQLRRGNPALAGEDMALISLIFDDWTTGLFDGSRLNDHPSDNPRRTMGEMMVEGSSTVLRLDGYGRLWLRPHGSETEVQHGYDWEDRAFAGDCVYRFQEHALAVLNGQQVPETAGQEYLANVRLVEACYRSDQTGTRQTLKD